MIFLDISILPVALPAIQSLFHSSSEQLQWMVNSYLLALSSRYLWIYKSFSFKPWLFWLELLYL